MKKEAMSPLNVILIDDEKFLRDVIQEGLVELFGCTVRAVPDGESGLACLRESGADVLLLDLLMPGVNGFEVLARLQSGNEMMHRPDRVIAMSALTDRTTLQTLRKLGVDYVLPKPFSLAELRAALRLGEPTAYGSSARAIPVAQSA